MDKSVYTFKPKNTKNEMGSGVHVIEFDGVESLFKDMALNYQSFTKSEREMSDSGDQCVVEGYSTYRTVGLDKDGLSFYFDDLDGAEFCIVGNVVRSFKTDIDNCLSEFNIYVEGRKCPYIFLGCLK